MSSAEPPHAAHAGARAHETDSYGDLRLGAHARSSFATNASQDVKSRRVGALGAHFALGECLSIHARLPLLADALGRGRGRHDQGRGLVQPQLRLRKPPRRTVHGRSAHVGHHLPARPHWSARKCRRKLRLRLRL